MLGPATFSPVQLWCNRCSDPSSSDSTCSYPMPQKKHDFRTWTGSSFLLAPSSTSPSGATKPEYLLSAHQATCLSKPSACSLPVVNVLNRQSPSRRRKRMWHTDI